jgi:hypothetical protein
MSEELWAAQLKKQKNRSNIPLDTQEKNTKDRIAYQKALLLEALKQKNDEDVRASFRSLLELRARLLFLRLQKRKEKGEYVDDKILHEEADTFTRESINLAQALNISL